MKINIDTEKLNLKGILPYAVIAVLAIFLLMDKCKGCSDNESAVISEQAAANPNAENARRFTLAAGSQILNSCANSPRNARRMFTSVETLPNNPNRLRINMYVTWKGRSSCRYRINGVLTVNTDGCNPSFTRTDDSSSRAFCVFMPGCASNVQLPECLD